MRSPLHELEGLTVTKVAQIHDYVQLHFGDQIGLSIYNRLEIYPASISVVEFTCKTLISVFESATEIALEFLDGTQIKIDMHAQAYKGPEALELSRYGYPPLVWN